MQNTQKTSQFKNLMLIFCSTSVLDKALQNSWNEIIWSLSSSASRIVRSAMLVNCSSLIFAPTIMWRIASNSSRLIISSLSKSYILKATAKNKTSEWVITSLSFAFVCSIQLWNLPFFSIQIWKYSKINTHISTFVLENSTYSLYSS